MTAFLVIFLFVLLIFPHELGHFLMAKACKVQVNEFAFGMGPAIFKKQGKETLYSIRLLPIGGYCAMEGEDSTDGNENPKAFNNKTWWQKILILLGGVIMNILIAWAVCSIAVGLSGIPNTTIGDVQKDSPAYVAGLEKGDKIIEINREKIESPKRLIEKIGESKDVDLVYLRDGKEKRAVITPKDSKIGIVLSASHNPIKAIGYGAKVTVNMSKNLINILRSMVTNPATLKEVSGPVGMIKIVSQSASYGIIPYLYMTALISLNLAVFNLLPLPALDGGRILFVVVRKLTGNLITDNLEAKVHAIGMLILLILIVLVTWHDIERIFL